MGQAETRRTRHEWTPITDLPDNWPEMVNAELQSLPNYWHNQRSKLTELSDVTRFEEHLQREWAIETGAIEDVYRIDKGTTETLIEHGIRAALIPHGATDKPAELVADIIQAQKDALEGIFAFVKQDRQLSAGYIKELHASLTRHQNVVTARDPKGNLVEVALEHGKYKTHPNNPQKSDGEVHEYCPPEHVASEMDRLVAMHLKHETVSVEVESAWLHHRFTQIHPFQDGNGRVARALASLVAIRSGWFPLLIRRSDVAEYIGALEQADQGILWPLVTLFARRHIETFNQANRIAQMVLGRKTVHEGVRQKLRGQGSAGQPEWDDVFVLSRHLEGIAVRALEADRDELRRSCSESRPDYAVEVQYVQFDNTPEVRDYIYSRGRSINRTVDTSHTPASVRLVVKEERKVEFVILFHPVFGPFDGTCRVVSFGLYHFPDDGESQAMPDVKDSGVGFFEIGHNSDRQRISHIFEEWLNGAVTELIRAWSQSL
jgi:Fic family protein